MYYGKVKYAPISNATPRFLPDFIDDRSYKYVTYDKNIYYIKAETGNSLRIGQTTFRFEFFTTLTETEVKTITHLKAFHKAAGGHFFDRAAISFFKGKIETNLINKEFFIDSSQFEDQPRLYKIRRVDPGFPCGIETVLFTGQTVNSYASKKLALEMLKLHIGDLSGIISRR